ncbi:MAG: hypothetical protein QF645_11090, partial [Planctomycetota bacterium]|nr:hypothetical protein [Planctomycetota bacterium]
PSRFWNAGSFLVLGVLSAVGIGWRGDALMIPPFLLVGILVLHFWNRRGWRRGVASVLLFVAGVISVFVFRGYLGREVESRGSTLGVFHVAHYAESARTIHAHYPNYFQVVRKDGLTSHQAHEWQKMHYPEDTFVFMQKNYGLYCLELFLEQARHNAYEWMKDLPEFWWKVLSEVANSKVNEGTRRPAFGVPPRIFLSSLPLSVFAVFWLLWVGRNRETVLYLVALSVYYALLLWFMLPETKHYTPMVIPLAVLGGVGGFGLLQVLLVPQERRVLRKNWRPGVRFLAVLAFVVAMVYYPPFFLSRWIQKDRRATYEEALTLLAREESGWVEEATGTNRFVHTVREGDDRSPRLFVLDIEGAGPREILTCWNQHGFVDPKFVKVERYKPSFSFRVRGTNRYRFYVTAIPVLSPRNVESLGSRGEEIYRLTAELSGSARIVRCRSRLLDGWEYAPFYNNLFLVRD